MFCPVCQIEDSFLFTNGKMSRKLTGAPPAWRRFFWAPGASSVKIDGFEGFSSITHADLCDM